MDHMRISGTEPASVILSQTKKLKNLKSDVPKISKQAEAKKDGVINPDKISILINFIPENVDALKTIRINRSRS